MNKKKKEAFFKSIIKTIGVFLVVPILWWFVFGAGVPVLKSLLGVGGVEDGSHHLYMSDEQNIDLMRRALPTEEFSVWEKYWDLKKRPNEWKRENAQEVGAIESDFKNWQTMHNQLRQLDYNTYRKKYAPLFGEIHKNNTSGVKND